MRGAIPLRTIAERTGLPVDALVELEGGRLRADERLARDVLKRGFGLDRQDASRVLLGVHLYDVGLRDNEIRQLVADVILKLAPDEVQTELRRLYRTYAE